MTAHDSAAPLPGAAPDRFLVVALVASAGGLNALTSTLSALPAEFPAAIVVVQHLDPRRKSLLAELLAHRTPLAVKQAEEGDRLRPGAVFIAPPNHHLLVNPDGTLSLSTTARVHFSRPSANVLLESLAAGVGPRAVAVVLSGSGLDGAGALRAVKRCGGRVIVQDEATSQFFGMPGAAIATGEADAILPLEGIADALVQLALRPAHS